MDPPIWVVPPSYLGCISTWYVQRIFGSWYRYRQKLNLKGTLPCTKNQQISRKQDSGRITWPGGVALGLHLWNSTKLLRRIQHPLRLSIQREHSSCPENPVYTMSSSPQPLEPAGYSLAVPPPERTKNPTQTAVSAPGIDTSTTDSYPREATADDLAKLRHVAGEVPAIVWLVAFTGAAQRFAFYGTTVPWRKIDSGSDISIEVCKVSNSS